MTEEMKQQPSVSIDVTAGGDTEVFRIGVADEILRLLVDAHETEFTISELVDATGGARSTVTRPTSSSDSTFRTLRSSSSGKRVCYTD